MANILVVDDEHGVRRLIAKWLIVAGYDVLEAETGGEAVEIARHSLIWLIIMDVKLPDMTGFAATDRIRALPGHTTTPVICLTGLDMRIDVAHEAGCTDLLLKPVDRDKLVGTVQRHLHLVTKSAATKQDRSSTKS